MNPTYEAAVAPASGSTGHWPVPSGYQPLGTGKAHEVIHALVSKFHVLLVPSGQWPDGTGGSPVLPILLRSSG